MNDTNRTSAPSHGPAGACDCDCGREAAGAGASDSGGSSCCALCDSVGQPVRRSLHLLLVAVLGISATGYFAGLRGNTPAPRGGAEARAAEVGRPSEVPPEALAKVPTAGVPTAGVPIAGVPAAVRYAEMDAIARGPNGAWRNHLSKLVPPSPPAPLTDPVVPAPEQKPTALAERATRRAYDGAPPVVPHPIPQQSAEACLACHGEGLRVADRVAPKISHERYANCTQCHVESDNRAVPPSGAWAENFFAGKPSPAAGPRAWTGAPPQIPHATLMRSDCMSCHGPTGHAALKSSHPSRQSCTQCHAPAADQDQVPAVLR